MHHQQKKHCLALYNDKKKCFTYGSIEAIEKVENLSPVNETVFESPLSFSPTYDGSCTDMVIYANNNECYSIWLYLKDGWTQFLPPFNTDRIMDTVA